MTARWGVLAAIAALLTAAVPASAAELVAREVSAGGNATGEPVSASGQGATSFEQVALADPSGGYVARVIDYAAVEPWSGTASFEGPEPHRAA